VRKNGERIMVKSLILTFCFISMLIIGITTNTVHYVIAIGTLLGIEIGWIYLKSTLKILLKKTID